MRRSISRILSSLAEVDPDRVVVIADDATLTASELDRRSNRLARAYIELGVLTDDRVMISLPNSAEYVVVCAAVWKAGATPQLVSPDLHADEAREIEELSAPRLVIGRAAETAGTPWLPAGWRPDDALSDAVLEDRWAQCWKAPTSSGSTGRPKVVLAAGPALMDDSRAVAPFLPMDAIQLVAGPLGHSATFTYAFRGLMTGHRLVILPRFDEERVLAAIAEHRVSWALLVPTMIHRLLRRGGRDAVDASSLETVLHMGSPIAADDKRALIDWVGASTVVEVYAGSESNGLTMIRGDEWLLHPGSVGRPIGGTELRIQRGDGTEADRGEAGEIWMRRAGEPTYRYLGGSSRRTDKGWDTLGDIGSVDSEGYLTVLDRANDLILRGGVNVYPADIERILEAHPLVRSAVAYGIPDAELGQAIAAVVDVADADVTVEQILDATRARLGRERRLQRLELTREPLRDDAGKLRRSAFAQPQ
ncbi:AMP-binding protein [Microbacteriaceae bacterium VKM Ac-2855]|nr:AMP-binding protein [Microbacteriaceae bacterium VKM Ac-2855]